MRPEELLQPPLPRRKLGLGCPILNQFLSGGIPCSTITEIVAESGTGKTQLCLQLLLSSQYPPSPSSSVFLHSESPFPSRRLSLLSLSHPSLPSPLHNILLRPIHSPLHLLHTLPLLPTIIHSSSPPLRLLVIDSIAGLFRAEFGNTREEMLARSRLLFRIAGELKRQAVRYGLAVVVTNQVGDVVDDGGFRIGNSEWMVSSGRRVIPALGLAWSHCVNVRLFMWREEEVEREGEDDENVRFRTRRFIRVVFAPHLPDSSCQFVIRREGLFGIDG